MRLINWLRRLFCAHQFEIMRNVSYYRVDKNGNQVGDIPVDRKIVQRCARCGWIWRQRA